MAPANRSQRSGDRAYLAIATAILLLGALLRLAWLREVPPGLSQDEVLNADIATFILQGRHALFFREGYGHEPLFHYLATPFQVLYGDNLLAIRAPATYLGLLLIALTIRWGRVQFGRRTGLLAGAWLAVSWWPIIFSRIGLRAILEPVVLVLAVSFWPLPGHTSTRRSLLAGTFLGLALYTYTAAQVVLLIPLLYAGYVGLCHWRKGALGIVRTVFPSAVVFLVAALIALPLAWLLTQDPSLLQRVDQLAGPLEALRTGDFLPLLESTLLTLGAFSFASDPRPTYMPPGYTLFDPLTALFFFGGLMLSARAAPRKAQYGLALIWLAVTLVPSAVTPQSPSTIRMIGALPVVFLMPALATDWILGRFAYPTLSRGGARLVALLPLVLLGVQLGRTIQAGFIEWPTQLETRVRYQSVFRDIASDISAHAELTPVIADAYFEPIDHDTVRRNLGAPLPARWIQQGQALIFPSEGNARLYIPEFAPLHPALFASASLENEPLYRSGGTPSFTVYDLPDTPNVTPLTSPVSFDERLTLQAYQRLAVTEEGVLPLLTTWQVEDSVASDLAIFVHLLGPDGSIIAQYDGLDAAASLLRPGDRFVQLHRLVLPETLPSGPFDLQVGLYTRSNGKRLPVPTALGDRYLLEQAVQIDDG